MQETGEPTGERWRLGHRPALDGLRGVAVLMVVTYHLVNTDWWGFGTSGVTMFFTLSGFLITALLLQERDRTGAVSLRRFYEKRALRLLPAFAVLLATCAALEYVVLGQVPGIVQIVLYVGNWPMAAGGHTQLLVHTWSLSIEEQFYLLWPVVLLAALRWQGRRGVLGVALAGAGLSCALRSISWLGFEDGRWAYYSTAARVDALLVGCALAAVLTSRRESLPAPPRGLLAVGAVAMFAVGPFDAGTVCFVVAPVVATLVACAVIWAACSRDVPMLRWRPLVEVGRRSYGLYLWHFPVMGVTGWLLLPERIGSLQCTVLALAVSGLLTAASWRFVERPFLAKKEQLGAGALRSRARQTSLSMQTRGA